MFGPVQAPRQPSGPVTSGLGRPQSSAYYNYKSKGFGESLSQFLGRYNMDSFLANQAAERAARQQQQVSGGTGNSSIGNGGGAYANVDRWNSQILTAVDRVKREFGIDVPPNLVKAVMMLESEGNMVGCNEDGYCGLMQTGAGSNVANFDAGYNATVEGNIYYGTQELANWYRDIGTGNWIDAAAAYFSGWNYNNYSVSDRYGTDVGAYRSRIEQYLAVFNGGSQQYGGGGGGARNALATMFPNGEPGYDFGVSSGNGLYGYGTSYGLNGSQHTGMDVPQPLGSSLYAPGDAIVVCVGCWRNDHITGGVGRIELEMPDGARVLYDHTYSSAVNVGDRVVAGQFLGTSGGMYSPHTHLEVRVPDSSQEAGYRLVDPAAYFAGYVGGGGYSSSGGYTPALTSKQRAQQILYGRYW